MHKFPTYKHPPLPPDYKLSQIQAPLQMNLIYFDILKLTCNN